MDYLKQIPDHRDPHGLRHPLWLVLLIIIMGMMSGYWGYRQLGRFVERHRRELINRLQIHACSCSFLFSDQKSHG
ncbi:transposase family protein [Moorena sp. SIO2C4]|uniref:transposase family protein n=1 Tax=Moorena sp. SIO2C4 TaxID=2607824 RepID=UPI00338FB885